MDKQTFTTQQVAVWFGISYSRLANLLTEQPHLRPAKKGRSLQWTHDDIDAVVQWRKTHRSGRRKK